MGLSKQSVDKAITLFNDIDKKRSQHVQECLDFKTNFDLTYIFGLGYEPCYAGWENLWINVKDITPEQRATWERGRINFGNTSFTDTAPGGVTRLGFI